MIRIFSVEEIKKKHYKKKMHIYTHKNTLGEVFTPFIIIEKIVDQIPITILRNPKSTFLEPSAGIGGFFLVLYDRLMKELKDAIPSPQNRSNHIIKEMLYAIEINNNNVKFIKKIFGSDLNIYKGDALKIDRLSSIFSNLENVDVVVGNPPFEKRGYIIDEMHNKSISLWTQFVYKSFTQWLNKSGCMGMVLPPTWRKPSSNRSSTFGLWELLSPHISWLEMYDRKSSTQFFNDLIHINIDLLFLCKSFHNKKAHVKSIHNEITKEYLYKWPFLPNGHLKFWKNWLNKDNNNTMGFIYSASAYHNMSNITNHKTSKYKFPIVHAIHHDGEVVYKYSNKRKKEGGFGLSKLIFNGYGAWNPPILDMDGKYGMSNVVYGIPINNIVYGKNLLELFSREDVLKLFFTDMMWFTSRPTQSWHLFNYLKKDFTPPACWTV